MSFAADGYEFARATPDDIPLLARWLERDHVRRWWGDPDEELAEIARIFGDPSMEALIVSHDGRPFAHQQSWDPSCWTDYPLQDQPPGTRGIDQFIGDVDMLGQGHGARFIRAFALRLFAEGAPRVVIDPDPENHAAIRAYEKAGFRALEVRETGDGPALIMIQEPV
jgi:aminoglycoside 6'-N-acetyltransferase